MHKGLLLPAAALFSGKALAEMRGSHRIGTGFFIAHLDRGQIALGPGDIVGTLAHITAYTRVFHTKHLLNLRWR